MCLLQSNACGSTMDDDDDAAKKQCSHLFSQVIGLVVCKHTYACYVGNREQCVWPLSIEINPPIGMFRHGNRAGWGRVLPSPFSSLTLIYLPVILPIPNGDEKLNLIPVPNEFGYSCPISSPQ